MFDFSSYFPVYLLAFIDMDLTTAMHSIKALGSKVFPKEASTGGRSSFAGKCTNRKIYRKNGHAYLNRHCNILFSQVS